MTPTKLAEELKWEFAPLRSPTLTPITSRTQGRGRQTEVLIEKGETERKGERQSPRAWVEE